MCTAVGKQKTARWHLASRSSGSRVARAGSAKSTNENKSNNAHSPPDNRERSIVDILSSLGTHSHGTRVSIVKYTSIQTWATHHDRVSALTRTTRWPRVSLSTLSHLKTSLFSNRTVTIMVGVRYFTAFTRALISGGYLQLLRKETQKTLNVALTLHSPKIARCWYNSSLYH